MLRVWGYLQEVDRAKLAEAGCNAIFEPVSLYHQGGSRGGWDAGIVSLFIQG